MPSPGTLGEQVTGEPGPQPGRVAAYQINHQNTATRGSPQFSQDLYGFVGLKVVEGQTASDNVEAAIGKRQTSRIAMYQSNRVAYVYLRYPQNLLTAVEGSKPQIDTERFPPLHHGKRNIGGTCGCIENSCVAALRQKGAQVSYSNGGST
jgi:hypothetical protein